MSVVDHIAFDELTEYSHHAFDLRAFDQADAAACTIPVHVITGAVKRPELVAIAGIHGDEPDGILALIKASREISPHKLRGQLVLVPIANPPAFIAGQRRSPIDGVDLNRVFPGSSNGSPTERLAYCLFEHLVRNADFLFTLHSWFASGTVLPFIEVPDGNSEVARRSLAAAQASGFERIRMTAWPAGVLVAVAIAAGIPAMEAEIGDSGLPRRDNQEQYFSHLMALLRHLEMYGRDEAQPVVAPRYYRGQHARSETEGMLNVNVALGATVAAGEILGDVSDLHGTFLRHIKSPLSGIVISRRNYPSVSVGDIVATIFSQAERASDPANAEMSKSASV